MVRACAKVGRLLSKRDLAVDSPAASADEARGGKDGFDRLIHQEKWTKFSAWDARLDRSRRAVHDTLDHLEFLFTQGEILRS